MSYKFLEWAWNAPDVTSSGKIVLLTLVDHADENGMCYPSIPRIGRMANLSERQVQRVLKTLEKKGYLRIEPQFSAAGDRTSNRYHLIVERKAASEVDIITGRWAEFLKAIHAKVGTQRFHTWYQPMRPLSLKSGCLEIGIPNTFFEDYLNDQVEVLLDACKASRVPAHRISIRVAIVIPGDGKKKK